jgi:hypothetical protein
MPEWKPIVGRGFTSSEFEKYVDSLSFGTWKPNFIVLHNTARPTFAEWHTVPGQTRMRNLETYYRSLGWSAGPHLFIADDLIWVFTPLTIRGVHAPSWNKISWGVELVGDYEQEQLPPALEANAVAGLTALHKCIACDPVTLKLHREDPKTTHKGCPGRNVRRDHFVEAVHAQLKERVENPLA